MIPHMNFFPKTVDLRPRSTNLSNFDTASLEVPLPKVCNGKR